MPCDTNLVNTSSDEFTNTLDSIEQLMNAEGYDSYIILGDWNTSFLNIPHKHSVCVILLQEIILLNAGTILKFHINILM